MSVKLTLSALVLALGSSAAFAAGAVSNDAQLAARAGVAVGAYSVSELNALIQARKDGDANAETFILNRGLRAEVKTGTAANAQLEAELNVEPGRYTYPQLRAIAEARNTGHEAGAALAIAALNREASGDAAVVTPAEAQLAAQLGVDPAAYTLAELTALNAAAHD